MAKFDFKNMKKNTKNQFITYAMVIVIFVVIQTLISTGNMSSLDMALVYLGPLMQVISFINIILLGMFRILGIELNDIFSYLF